MDRAGDSLLRKSGLRVRDSLLGVCSIRNVSLLPNGTPSLAEAGSVMGRISVGAWAFCLKDCSLGY